jgi:hypothetical protein
MTPAIVSVDSGEKRLAVGVGELRRARSDERGWQPVRIGLAASARTAMSGTRSGPQSETIPAVRIETVTATGQGTAPDSLHAGDAAHGLDRNAPAEAHAQKPLLRRQRCIRSVPLCQTSCRLNRDWNL